MLSSWGSFVYRRRRLVVALSGLSLVAAILLMVFAAGSLSSSGFVDKQSESQQVAAQLADDFGRGREQLVFIFDGTISVSDPTVQATIESALQPVIADPRVTQVLTTWNTGNPAFVSHDGKSTFAVALLNVEDDEALDLMDALSPLVAKSVEPAGFTLSLAGFPAIGKDIAHEVEEGILRAETVSVPLTIVIQLLVFGTLIAAGLPLLVGGLAIIGSIAGILVMANVSNQSIFAVNIISMLGLALGVDYSLFMVSRFREELANGNTEYALIRTMRTTGKAILFSGLTVIFGLAATFFFPLPALQSMGLSGMIVVALAVIYGLSFLPAMLAISGERINRYAVRIPGRKSSEKSESRFWGVVANTVMRRPVWVLVPVLAILILAGAPFLRLELTPGGPDVLPDHAPSRIASERLESDFPTGEADPIPVIFTISDSEVLTPVGLSTLQAFIEQTESLPNVTRVESILTDPVTASVNWQALVAGETDIPAAAKSLVDQLVHANTTLIQIVSDGENDELEKVVRDLRGIEPVGASFQVGGSAASSVDTIDGIKAGLPTALIFVILGSYFILLFTFGSVILPIKAILMTLLSISASLGALVLVFQDGRFENLLGFTATGEIISTTPILMFCILFGLSMDYEVLMLTRIQEEYQRTGDNEASVSFGLQRTGKVITSAAAIMVVAFGAFMLADIVIIKSFGFGLTLAVLIDATIVRGLLVPATMRLLGDLNWWAPQPVTRLVNRLGLSHGESPVTDGAFGSATAD